jgi:hypothetical protein
MKPTRAKTMHEEQHPGDGDDCLTRLVIVIAASLLFLHPGLTSLPTKSAAADISPAAAPISLPTPTAGGRAIADIPQPLPCASTPWYFDTACTIRMHDVGLPTWVCASTIPDALSAYLGQHNAPDGTAALLLDGIAVARGMGYETPDPLLFACLARYESGFHDSSIGKHGERGLLQIHPVHKRGMKRLGLNFYSGKDRIAYGCILYAAQGLKPWAVRSRAMKDYRGAK